MRLGRRLVQVAGLCRRDSPFCLLMMIVRAPFMIFPTPRRTALAPLLNNVLSRRHGLTNLTLDNRQWWYKPSGPLIVSTASNQKVVSAYDVRDGEHIMKWEVPNCVLSMENSIPLQWRNRGKVVVADVECVCLWDVGSLTPEPLLSVSSNGKKISALYV